MVGLGSWLLLLHLLLLLFLLGKLGWTWQVSDAHVGVAHRYARPVRLHLLHLEVVALILKSDALLSHAEWAHGQSIHHLMVALGRPGLTIVLVLLVELHVAQNIAGIVPATRAGRACECRHGQEALALVDVCDVFISRVWVM